MEFSEKLDIYLKIDEDGFIICNGKNNMGKLKPQQHVEALKLFANIVNTSGARSAKAQNLKQVITSLDRFVGTDQRLYIKIANNKVLGFLKAG